MNRIRAIILDFDGVLAESNDEKTAAFEQLFALYPEHSQTMMDYHLAHHSAPRMEKFAHYAEMLIGAPGDAKVIGKMATQFSQLVVERVVACPSVAGSLAFLQEFSALVPLYVSSVTPQDELRDILRMRELNSYFVEAFGNPPTPKYRAIQHVLERESLEPGDVAFVGDSLSDYRAATKANLRFFGRDSGLPFDGVEVALFPDMSAIGDQLRWRI